MHDVSRTTERGFKQPARAVVVFDQQDDSRRERNHGMVACGSASRRVPCWRSSVTAVAVQSWDAISNLGATVINRIIYTPSGHRIGVG